MTKFLIVGSGFLMSKLSYSILGVFVSFLAKLYLFVPSKRKRLLFSNLTHAFPDWPYTQIKSAALESTVYLFEMGFFSLIYPHLSKFERRSTLVYPADEDRQLAELRQNGEPVLFLLPHVTLFESIATSSAFRPGNGKTLGAIYRPNSNSSLDSWVNNSRVNLGLKTFSRKKGLIQARKHLIEGNWLALLFDQNAGLNGELSLFIDRLCSITPLPDILLKGISAKVILVCPFRLSFFRARLKFHQLGQVPIGEVSKTAHHKIEQMIISHPKGMPEWLWSHGKWKTQNSPQQIFQLHLKRNKLPKPSLIPRKTKIWIRMPNWLGDVVMALPLINAIKEGRPDAEITLLCQVQYKSLLEHMNVGHRVITMPKKGLGYFIKLLPLRNQFPDIHFLFTNSLRGDIEAYICGSPLRLGGSTGRKRKMLSHQSIISKEYKKKHQVLLWEKYLRYFGLQKEICYSPLVSKSLSKKNEAVVCIAPGSSNSPEKRWPVGYWIVLLEKLLQDFPSHTFMILGTSNDSKICNMIRTQVNNERVQDQSGKTSIVDLVDCFERSTALVCNDSGAMHLANAVGLPLVAIFGPTDPSVTGPVYESPSIKIKCAEGDNIKDISPESVIREVSGVLSS